MGEAKRRKLAGSGPQPPKERIIRVAPPNRHMVVGRGGVFRMGTLAAALAMSMMNDYPTLPTRGRGQHK